MLSSVMSITTLAAALLAVLTSGADLRDDVRMSPYHRTLVLVGVDRTSNPYIGDTKVSEAHSMLCLIPLGLPEPKGLNPAPYQTPGGAMRNTWSGGKLFVVPLVEGTYLASEEIADGLCEKHAVMNFGVSGARMAEFHDGNSEQWAGWAFWSEALLLPQNGQHTFDGRLWVKINDQDTNPWSTVSNQLALTFIKIAEQYDGGIVIGQPIEIQRKV